MNMHKWMEDVKASKIKKPMPILSFPCVQLLGTSVKQLVSDSELQARGMKAVADRVDSLASVSFMDLSVEAEAFGAEIKTFEMEVPTVTNVLVKSMEDGERLEVPDISKGRIPIFLEGMERALERIKDRPVFAGVIGPFSLAGRLVDVNKAMLYCKKNPQLLKVVLRKTTDFLIDYIKAYKSIGANGVIMAEPLTGLISPKLAEEFSEPYVREIAKAIGSEDFLVIYHNCGNAALKQVSSIKRTGCDGYHFGNAIDMKAMLEAFDGDKIVMGNIDPAGEFTNGTVDSIRHATRQLMDSCSMHSNFVISSGCDIPPAAKWENIDGFFEAATNC